MILKIFKFYLQKQNYLAKTIKLNNISSKITGVKHYIIIILT